MRDGWRESVHGGATAVLTRRARASERSGVVCVHRGARRSGALPGAARGSRDSRTRATHVRDPRLSGCHTPTCGCAEKDRGIGVRLYQYYKVYSVWI